MADTTPLASLSLTHVYYDPSDRISFLCAWLALVPQALCVVYVTLMWSTRELEVGLMFAGQLGCEAVNFALKRLIKEERPPRIHSTGKGYGMPSSHAQFAVFWAVSLALFLLLRHRPHAPPAATTTTTSATATSTASPADPAHTHTRRHTTGGAYHKPLTMLERAVASAGALLLAALVAWSRTYLGYHTVKQVLVGCAAGLLSAAGWFVATEVARRWGLVAWLLALPPVRYLRVRDLVVEEDLCQAGWEKWEEKMALARQDKTK